MKKLDWYILKRYLITFLFTLLILIPIAVAIDVAEKIDKFLVHDDLTLVQVVNDYYVNFIIYYVNTFMPLALFVAVIFFTSQLASKSEIVAITSAQISFTRFLYPYFIGATIVTLFAFFMNHFFVPSSNKVRKKFEKEYIKKSRYRDTSIRNFSLQLNDSTYMFIQNYDLKRNSGYNFSIEVYDGLQVKRKFTADNINWKEEDSSFTLFNWKTRNIFDKIDTFDKGSRLDTTFVFTPKDFNYQSTLSQEMPSIELNKFIDISRKRGVKNLNSYLVELYKRTSLPIASYILTIIAVALAYKKRRGGVGVNMALGILIMFLYVFLMKIGEVLGAVAGAHSLLNVWLPNILFGCLAIYLYFYAKK